jgi:tripartite-type tricarboxylate transporter receptor subunit TctC
MTLHRRAFLSLAAGAAALPALSQMARAQSYPTRPVRIVTGFPPGGLFDIHARIMAQWMSEQAGRQFYVENRPGAGGKIATEVVVRAPADGYTLLLSGSNDSFNTGLYDNLKYNFLDDLVPVSGIASGGGLLVAHPSFSAKSVPELISAAKASPGRITVASSGVGSLPHLYWELFRSLAKVEMLHVPYRGGGPALTDLLAGQVQVFFATIPSAIEHVRAGKLRPLAVTSATRMDVLPDVPALSEAVPGYEASGYTGIFAPRNTPPEIIDTLNKQITAGLLSPVIKARFAQLGDAVLTSSPAEFRKYVAEYTGKWAKVIRAAGIKGE